MAAPQSAGRARPAVQCQVSVTGALMDQVRLLRCLFKNLRALSKGQCGIRRNLTVGTGGLTFEQVQVRAKVGHESRSSLFAQLPWIRARCI